MSYYPPNSGNSSRMPQPPPPPPNSGNGKYHSSSMPQPPPPLPSGPDYSDSLVYNTTYRGRVYSTQEADPKLVFIFVVVFICIVALLYFLMFK